MKAEILCIQSKSVQLKYVKVNNDIAGIIHFLFKAMNDNEIIVNEVIKINFASVK